MSGVDLFLGLGGLALQAIGTISAARAQRRQGETEAAFLRAHAARQREAAGVEAGEFRRKARRIAGTQRARVGAAGVAAEGTPLLLFEDLAAEAELQAQRILTAGLGEAATLEAEAGLARSGARSAATETLISGFGSTLLTGAPLISGSDFFGRQSLGAPKTVGSTTARKAGFG